MSPENENKAIADEIDNIQGLVAQPSDAKDIHPEFSDGKESEETSDSEEDSDTEDEEETKKEESEDVRGDDSEEEGERKETEQKTTEGTHEDGEGEDREEEEREEEDEDDEEVSESRDIELLREQNEKLMTLVNNLSNPQTSLSAKKIKEEVEEPETTPPPTQVILPTLDEESFDTLMRDQGAFTKYVADVAQAAAQLARQQVLVELPETIRQSNILEKRVNTFFALPENQDLQPLMQFVGRKAVSIENDNPDLSIEEVLKRAGNEVRELAALSVEKSKGKKKTKPKKGRFVKATSTRVPRKKEVKPSPENQTADDIDDLADLEF